MLAQLTSASFKLTYSCNAHRIIVTKLKNISQTITKSLIINKLKGITIDFATAPQNQMSHSSPIRFEK